MLQPERALSSAGREDERARLRRLFETEFDFVWRCLRRFGLSREAADDAAQEVFLIVSRRLSEIEPGKERSFLFGTASRVAMTARRSYARRREVSGEGMEERDGHVPDPEELEERRRKLALLHRALDGLPMELRTVLVLHEIEGMTAAEIAAMLALPPGTVASRLRRAREQFREVLVALVGRSA